MTPADAPATPAPGLAQLWRDTWRLLTFRRPGAALAEHWPRYLAFAALFTWLAGVGRYWDNPRAPLWQHLGLGSLAYVVCLALLLYLLIWPLRPARWRYRTVLLFVGLTSPPALLYAIPVERFLPLALAQQANVAFLAVVASWRVALLVLFLRRVAALSWAAVAVAALLPLCVIVVTLTLLNLEHVVFEIMAGIAPEDASGNDLAYLVVLGLGLLSMYATPALLVLYLALTAHAWLARPSSQRGAD